MGFGSPSQPGEQTRAAVCSRADTSECSVLHACLTSRIRPLPKSLQWDLQARPCLKPPWARGTSYSGENGLRLSAGEVKAKQRATASTQRFPFFSSTKTGWHKVRPQEKQQRWPTYCLSQTGISHQSESQMLCWLPRSAQERESFPIQHFRKQLLMT